MKVRPIVNESALDCPMCGASTRNAHRERDCFNMIQWAAAVPDPTPNPSALPPSLNEAKIDSATREILADLKDRKGLRQAFDDIDEDVVEDEILPAWRSILRLIVFGPDPDPQDGG